MKLTTIQWRAAPVLALVLLAPVAHAGDEQRYLGASCFEEGPETGALHRSAYRITNNGTARTLLVCPIIRETMGACLSGGARLYASINIMDNHDEAVGCTLSVRGRDGTMGQYDSVATFNVKVFGLRTLSLDVGVWENNRHDSFVLECELPANGTAGFAKLYSYETEEAFGC